MTEEAQTQTEVLDERTAADIDAILQDTIRNSEMDLMQEVAAGTEAPESPATTGDQDAKETPQGEKIEETATKETKVVEDQTQTQNEPEKVVETPDQHAFKEMRLKLKEEREAREAVERRIKEIEEARNAPTEPSGPTMTVEQVVSALEKAKEGGFDTELDNAMAIKNAREALRTAFNSQDLTKVLANAQQGIYGPEASANIAAEISNAMQIVHANEYQKRMDAETQERKQQEEKASLQSAYQEQINRVKEEMPEFMNENSALSKFSLQWDAKYLGKLNPDTGQILEQGVYDQSYVNYLMSNPHTHARIIKEAFAASQVPSSESQLAQLQEQKRQIEQKIAQQNSVLPASAPIKSTTNERSAADINDQITQLIRDGALV